MSCRLSVGWLTLLWMSVVPGALLGQAREVCFERFPKTTLGAEVKSIVEDVLVSTSFTPSFPDEPCPSKMYRFDSIEVKGSSTKIVILACFLPPNAQKSDLCKRAEFQVPSNATKRQARIAEEVENIFNTSLYAHPRTPLGYYSVLSCSDSLQFRLQLAQDAVKSSSFEPCFYRLAFRVKAVGKTWYKATKLYVDSRAQPPTSIFADKAFSVTLAHWDLAPSDDRVELEESCLAGSYRNAFLIPYLRPRLAKQEDIFETGLSVGAAVDSGSNPSGRSKR